MVMLNRFLFLFLMLFLGSCSASQGKPRQLGVSIGAVMTDNYSGGVMVFMKDEIRGTSSSVELETSPFMVMIPDGKWSFYVVGFAGPTAWQGATNCGSALSLTLAETDLQIDITATLANCSLEPYASMINKKSSTWDQALWDQANWGL
jgi:hypothetical protein